MTKKEAVVISAYTGYLIAEFEYVHEYIEQILERSVWSHELASEVLWDEIREKAKPDFLKLEIK